MSHSSLFGIKENYTGEIICDFKNSWFFSPVIMSVLPDKYIPKFITTPFGFKKSIISDITGEVFKRTNHISQFITLIPGRKKKFMTVMEIY